MPLQVALRSMTAELERVLANIGEKTGESDLAPTAPLRNMAYLNLDRQLMTSRIINWVQVGQSLSWEEAFGLAAKAGGMLLKEDTAPQARWLANLAQSGPSDSAHETPSWTGAHREAGGWIWADGSLVASEKLSDLANHDASPFNDSAYVAAVGEFLVAPSEDVTAFLMEYGGKRVEGTAYSDWFALGGASPGVTILMRDGDDFYSDYNPDFPGPVFGGGVIDGGGGDDYIVSVSKTFTTAFDGDGRDEISLANGVIKAAADGDDDWFVTEQGRVSYEAAVGGLTSITSRSGEHVIYSAATGRDLVTTRELIGGAGDDVLSGFERLVGGGGDDILTPDAYAAGGRGDDTLIASSKSRAVLLGEAGDDTFILRSWAEVTGGAGADHYVFEAGGFARINDLGGDDRLDFSALVHAPVENPIAEGFIRLETAGGYTSVFLDADGGADEFVAVALIKAAPSGLSDYWLF
jgi:hypothetical protein